jgi:hypothetical protein
MTPATPPLGGTCRRERAVIGSSDRFPRSPRPRGVHHLSILTTTVISTAFVTTNLGKTLIESAPDSLALLMRPMCRINHQESGGRN